MLVTLIANHSEAEKIAKEWLDKSIKESKAAGLYFLPQNIGDVVLGYAQSNNQDVNEIADNIRKSLPRKREEGVRDEDVRWWWNLPDIEKRMLGEEYVFHKMGLYASETEGLDLHDKKTQNFGEGKVIKWFPMYGNPDDDTTQGDDRPIPAELKKRIDIYITKRAMNDSIQYKKDIEQSSTFNALIRKEIRDGKI